MMNKIGILENGTTVNITLIFIILIGILTLLGLLTVITYKKILFQNNLLRNLFTTRLEIFMESN
jgi:hypothetical protein